MGWRQASEGNRMVERFYSGRDGRVMVRETGEFIPLDLRLDLDRDGQASVNWGQNASGNRLAVALLADALDDDKVALNLAQAFTARVVGMLPERWTMSRARVLSFVQIIARESLENFPRDRHPSSIHPIEGADNRPGSKQKKFGPDVGER
jgi:hypothetical protein